jgi:hypothetical protein
MTGTSACSTTHASERHAAPLPARDPAPLPPTEEWVNVHTLGVAGDGKTDDTAAIQKAIDTHRVLYFPERALPRQRHAHVEARTRC